MPSERPSKAPGIATLALADGREVVAVHQKCDRSEVFREEGEGVQGAAISFLDERPPEADHGDGQSERFDHAAGRSIASAGRDHDFDAVLVSLDAPMPAEAIEALPDSVRAIATYSVGTDHIDLVAARKRGIAVFNTPGVLSDSVAENAIFLMLGAPV